MDLNPKIDKYKPLSEVKIDNPDLTEHMKEELMEVLRKRIDVFSQDANDIGRFNLFQMQINTGSAAPVRMRPIPLPHAKFDRMKVHLENLENKGLIYRAASPWQAPIFCVKKHDGSDRIVLNYTGLNKVLKPEIYPLPRITDLLARVGKPKFISVVDCNSGFFQIPLDPASQEKTGFSSPGLGSYCWAVMPQGISTGPAVFQKAIEIALSNLGKITALCYLDDLAIMSTDWSHHLRDLDIVFGRLIECGLKLRASKCNLACKSVKWLGHVISELGISPCEDKIKEVKNWPIPKNISDIRSFLGSVGYYRRFIKNFSAIAAPMNELLKKEKRFFWSPECQKSFEELKTKMITYPILQFPNFDKKFVLFTDASNYAIGAYLTQEDEGILKPIAFASRSLTQAERRQSTIEREILALIYGCDHFRQYLYSNNFIARTDHKPLVWLYEHPNPNSRLIRWALRLQEYIPFKLEYLRGKENVIADALSRKNTDKSLIESPQVASVTLDEIAGKNPEIVRKMQNKDPKYKNVIKYLEVGTLPEDPELQKRNFKIG